MPPGHRDNTPFNPSVSYRLSQRYPLSGARSFNKPCCAPSWALCPSAMFNKAAHRPRTWAVRRDPDRLSTPRAQSHAVLVASVNHRSLPFSPSLWLTFPLPFWFVKSHQAKREVGAALRPARCPGSWPQKSKCRTMNQTMEKGTAPAGLRSLSPAIYRRTWAEVIYPSSAIGDTRPALASRTAAVNGSTESTGIVR